MATSVSDESSEDGRPDATRTKPSLAARAPLAERGRMSGMSAVEPAGKNQCREKARLGASCSLGAWS